MRGMRGRSNGGPNTRKWHGDHGSSQDFTTFFFSIFPNEYTESDMFKVFQRWARVKEVFVSRRLNKWGRRFGFVRFFYVRNVRWLEGELDQLIVGNRKLYVNIPRYRRSQEEYDRYGRRELRNTEVGRHRGEGKEQQQETREKNGKKVWVEKQGSKSFVEAITGASQATWKEPTVKIPQQSMPWMKRSGIGHFKDDLTFDQVEEELLKGGLNMMQVRFLGDNHALLTPKEGEDLEALCSDNKPWIDSIFVSIKPWTPAFVVDHKRVWVRCYGLPLPLWNMEGFTQVVGKEATLVSVDDATLSWENLEFARLLVRTHLSHRLRWARTMRLNDLVCNIVMEEELSADGGDSCKCNVFDSTDSVSSSETYVEESSLSLKSGEDELRQWAGESSRPNREEDDRQEKVRGNLGTLSEKQFFKDLSTGIRDNQEKSCSSIMKEVSESRTPMEGAGLGSPSAFACAEVYSSSPIHDDLAKLVVDIEYSSSFTFKCNGLGQEGFLEAQPDMGGDLFPSEKEGGPRPAKETCGREEGSGGYAGGM